MLLQEELGLEVNDKKCMVGIVSRLTDQKGLDLVECVIEQICAENLQLVILGTGEQRYENLFRHYEWKYKDRVSSSIYYNNERSHKIYASCDAFLMPSMFEPCGLSQMIALRYGTIPVVREVGGLKDSVFDSADNYGNGFTFRNYDIADMCNAVKRALAGIYDNEGWHQLMWRAMMSDNSWERSAQDYINVYEDTMNWL